MKRVEIRQKNRVNLTRVQFYGDFKKSNSQSAMVEKWTEALHDDDVDEI